MDELETARAQVEDAIRHLGISPSACTMHAKGGATAQVSTSWTLKRGSAAILVSLVMRGNDVVVRVVSPVLIPKEETKAALYEHALELNAAGLGNCAFGVIADRLVLVSERPAKGSTVDEIEQILRHVGAVADAYDDKLVADFGGMRSSDHHDSRG